MNLKEGLRIPPFEPQAYSMTSPPIVVNGVVITGSSVADNSRPDFPSGEVRAFDARTGALKWSWDPIPQDPTDPAYSEWRGAMAHKTGAANAWSVLSGDPERDLVFVPTGSAAPDYYGALRLGNNRYANSIVALKASTGRVVWSFQIVHHDFWDYDNASPPALVTLAQRMAPAYRPSSGEQERNALRAERETPAGRSFPSRSGRSREHDSREEASRTQPFTTVTPPLSPHRFRVEDVWGISEDDRAACRTAIEGLRNEGIFTPPSLQGTLIMPSNIGGAHWGGVAIDPARQIAVVPVNRLAGDRPADSTRGVRSGEDARGRTAPRRRFRVQLHDTARRTSCAGAILLAPSQVPCTPPPFGTLVAINLNTGGRLWEVPLGSIAALTGDNCCEVPAGVGIPQPRRPDRHRRRRRLHRRDARSVAARVRHRDRPRALARRAARKAAKRRR